MRRMMVIVLALMLVGTIHAAEPVIPVYVVQPTGEFVDAALKDRQDSTQDVIKKLRRKEKTLVLVDSPDKAVVIIDILRRGVDETGDSTLSRNTLNGTVDAQAVKGYVVRARLTVGDYTTEVTGISIASELYPATWGSAAGMVATEIDKWIKANRAKLKK
jgi:hypothetical protein